MTSCDWVTTGVAWFCWSPHPPPPLWMKVLYVSFRRPQQWPQMNTHVLIPFHDCMNRWDDKVCKKIGSPSYGEVPGLEFTPRKMINDLEIWYLSLPMLRLDNTSIKQRLVCSATCWYYVSKVSGSESHWHNLPAGKHYYDCLCAVVLHHSVSISCYIMHWDDVWDEK